MGCGLRIFFEPQNIEQGISNYEVWNRFALPFCIIKNDRIPYFDIHNSLFDIRYSSKGSADGIELLFMP